MVQNVRHEFIGILSALVDTFPESPMFADLTFIKDPDLEGDFFENIRHIQVMYNVYGLFQLINIDNI